MELAHTQTQTPIIYHGMSLNDLLTALDLHFTEVRPLADEDIELAQQLLLSKVDGIKFQIDNWKKDADLHKGYALEHSEAVGVINNKIENLKERVVWAMKRSGKETLEGREYKVTLETDDSLITTADPTPEDAEWYPDFVRVKHEKTTYAWNKVPIKKAIRDSGFVFKHGHIEYKTRPEFPLNRKDK